MVRTKGKRIQIGLCSVALQRVEVGTGRRVTKAGVGLTKYDQTDWAQTMVQKTKENLVPPSGSAGESGCSMEVVSGGVEGSEGAKVMKKISTAENKSISAKNWCATRRRVAQDRW